MITPKKPFLAKYFSYFKTGPIAFIYALFLTTLLSGCGPEILRKHQKAYIDPIPLEHPEHFVTVNVSSFPAKKKASSPKKTVFNLSDRAQAAFLERADTNNAKAQALLNKNLLSLNAQSKSKIKDLSTYKRKIIISVAKTPYFYAKADNKSYKKKFQEPVEYSSGKTSGLRATWDNQKDIVTTSEDSSYSVYWNHLNNRIAHLDIRFQLDNPDHISFSNWDKLITEYETIDLGTITQASTNTFTFGASVPVGPDFITQDNTIGNESVDSFTENQTLRNRFMKLQGYLGEKDGYIIQEGNIDRDLAGNTILTYDIKFEADTFYIFKFDKLFEKTKSGYKARILRQSKESIITEIRPKEDALKVDKTKLKLHYSFIIRDINTNWGWFFWKNKRMQTFRESDDKVTYRLGGNTSSISLLGKEQINALKSTFSETWSITYKGEPIMFSFKQNASNPIPLQFASHKDAGEFQYWLEEAIKDDADSVNKKGKNDEELEGAFAGKLKTTLKSPSGKIVLPDKFKLTADQIKSKDKIDNLFIENFALVQN